MKNSKLFPITALSALGLVTLLTAPSVRGQTIALTGWNQDVIAEKTATSPSAGTTTPVGGVFYFYEQGAPSSSQGLPTGGSVTSIYGGGLTFQLQPYSNNNAVLVAGGSAAVTLTTPAAYQSLQFLVSGQGNGGGPVWTATLNFADIAPVTLGPTNTPDWTTGGANAAVQNVGLAIGNPWGNYYTGTLDLYEYDFAIPLLDQSHLLNSITLTETTGQTLMLFGLDGQATPPVETPEPSTWALVAGGMALLFVLNRRRLNV